MLDVHAPHAGIHSWKDFFIHIATITIGLLIAIGLEQTVEYVHHLSQLQAARQELTLEFAENKRIAQLNREQLGKQENALTQDMALLIASRASHAPLAGTLNYSWLFRLYRDGAWQAARQNGTLELMPHAELRASAVHGARRLSGCLQQAKLGYGSRHGHRPAVFKRRADAQGSG